MRGWAVVPERVVIGIALGPASDRIPDWRRKRGAVTGNVVHAIAPDWPGPACNNGCDPAVKRIGGWLIEAPAVTCYACRLLAGAGRA